MTGLWDSREDFMPLMYGHASGYTTQTTRVSCLWSSLELLSTTRSVFCQCVLYYVSNKFCFHELHKMYHIAFVEEVLVCYMKLK